jgi:hypothetical protein
MVYIGYGSFLLSCGSLDVYVDYDLVFRDKIVTDKVYPCDSVADVDDVDSSQLSAQQKVDTALYMHFNYNATNQQLRRMLRLDLSILEELFP